MDPHFFFSGDGSREFAVSALIASFVQQRDDFRTFLFGRFLCTEKPLGEPRVTVEENNVDVTIRYKDLVVLLEVKPRRGEYAENQLRNYYQREKRQNSKKKIIFALVHVGTDRGRTQLRQVEEVREEGDIVVEVLWSELTEYKPLPSDICGDFIARGLEAANKAMTRGGNARKKAHRGEDIVREIATQAKNTLSEKITFGNVAGWGSEPCVNYRTIRTNFTIEQKYYWSTLPITEHNIPFDLANKDELRLNLITEFRLSRRGANNRHLRERWMEFVNQTGETLSLDHITYSLTNRVYYQCRQHIEGSAQEIVNQAVSTGKGIIKLIDKIQKGRV